MAGELMHYAGEPVAFDRDWVYGQNEPHQVGKPNGLWVSVAGEDDWPSWCRDAEFGLDDLAYAHRVTLRPEANVARIISPDGIDRFHQAYAVETEFDRGFPSDYFYDRHRFWSVDWRKVVADWDGLIIAPYQWSRRLEGPMWYYGFDCASGAIWNLEAIESMELT